MLIKLKYMKADKVQMSIFYILARDYGDQKLKIF